MPPLESTPLMTPNDDTKNPVPTSLSMDCEDQPSDAKLSLLFTAGMAAAAVAGIALLSVSLTSRIHRSSPLRAQMQPIGPYKLLECQEGQEFFDFYDFYQGPDSLGSAGYNTYVSKERALQQGLVNVTEDEKFIFIKSAPTAQGPRESIRLEGKTRLNRGLFLLDLEHMPAGCGVWPAFWLTDEEHWPQNGEIDIVEGVNYQTSAKTALHTSESCSMYAHVPKWSWTGVWDNATGIPDTFTGELMTDTHVPADNCWNMAPHQWANQGCVAVDTRNDTIGQPLNRRGGGVYALEWDPANGYIKSWVFHQHYMPDNLQDSVDTAKLSGRAVLPDPSTWGAPYAYFAIGDRSGCAADHFQNMRIVFNLAFCGTVSGNRYFTDCPAQAKQFKVKEDPVQSCNAYIDSEPEELEEAYWKIRGVHVYERELAHVKMTKEKTD
jgi:hypothetical protein